MKTPLKLLLVRHGETDWNQAGRVQGQADIPLNQRGRAQAERLADRLAPLAIDALHASDLARAAETARILGARLGLDPVVSADWRELHLGALEGDDALETARKHGELISALAERDGPLAPGGESYAELEGRVERGFDRLCHGHAGQTVLVVGHGGVLKTLIARLIELPPRRIGRLSLRGNGSLSIVDFAHGRPQLVLLNDTSHWVDLPA